MAYYFIAIPFGAMSLLAAFSSTLAGYRLYTWKPFSGRKFIVMQQIGVAIYNLLWAIITAYALLSIASAGYEPPPADWFGIILTIASVAQALPIALFMLFLMGFISDGQEPQKAEIS